MASQGEEESCLSTEDQAIDIELTASGPADNVAEPLLSSEEIPTANTDQVEAQGTDLQQQEQEQVGTSGESGKNLLSVPFPKKLWAIVNDNNLQSVTWNLSGDSVVIEETLFKTEILHRTGNQKFFRTRNMDTFLHHLKWYGFQKINSQDSAGNTGQPHIVIYQHVNFHRDKPELVTNILRKTDVKIPVLKVKRSTPTTRKTSGAEPRAKRARLVPTRRSPRLHKTEEVNVEPQSEIPIQQGCAGSMSSLSTGGPTGSPTGGPTGSPTGGPTGSPTGSPTDGPSGSPTGGPDTHGKPCEPHPSLPPS